MQETQHGAQAKVDRHAKTPHPTAVAGKPGGVLPTGTDQFALVYNAATGNWEPTALPGSGVSASKGDPQNLGFPATVDPRNLAFTSGIGSANRTYYHRVTGGGTITKIGLYVAASSGNICVSVYANTGTGRASMPGNRVATSGSVACPAVGYQEIALGASVTVTSGDYWFAISLDNGTATFATAGTSGQAIQGMSAWQDSAFPSPATAAASNGGGSGGGSRWFGLIGAA